VTDMAWGQDKGEIDLFLGCYVDSIV